MNLLVHKYGLYKMSDIGTIPEMFTRFTDIVNRFKALASNVPNIEFVDKILCSLPKS